MLHERAMLINVSVSQWTARKHDQKASREVASQHGAKDAGRFNKLLIDSSQLKPMSQATNAIREYHYSHTLPWSDDGRRLLPSAMYFTYTTEMRALIDKFNAAADQFAARYQTLIQAERVRLGTLYDPNDYPADIRSRFSVVLSPEPVPAANDFRVDIGKDIAKVRAEIEAATAEREAKALSSLWARGKEVVQNVYDKLVDPDAIFRDSLIDHVQTFIDVAGPLNYTSNGDIEKLRERMTVIADASPDRLRNSPTFRSTICTVAREILDDTPWTS